LPPSNRDVEHVPAPICRHDIRRDCLAMFTRGYSVSFASWYFLHLEIPAVFHCVNCSCDAAVGSEIKDDRTRKPIGQFPRIHLRLPIQPKQLLIVRSRQRVREPSISLPWRGGRSTIRYTLQGVALMPLFIAAIRFQRSLAVRILNFAWVRFLGVLSYALYLCHSIILEATIRTWASGPVITGVHASPVP
jgi:hypothetical protein